MIWINYCIPGAGSGFLRPVIDDRSHYECRRASFESCTQTEMVLDQVLK